MERQQQLDRSYLGEFYFKLYKKSQRLEDKPKEIDRKSWVLNYNTRNRNIFERNKNNKAPEDDQIAIEVIKTEKPHWIKLNSFSTSTYSTYST